MSEKLTIIGVAGLQNSKTPQYSVVAQTKRGIFRHLTIFNTFKEADLLSKRLYRTVMVPEQWEPMKVIDKDKNQLH